MQLRLFKMDKKFINQLLKKSRKLKNKRIKQKKGFSREPAWLNQAIWYKVELWHETEDNQENLHILWLACRNFDDKEREFIRKYLASQKVKFNDRETEESKYILAYVEYYLGENSQEKNLNIAYIFPAKNPDRDTVSYPLYIRKWLSEYKSKYDRNMVTLLNDYVYLK